MRTFFAILFFTLLVGPILLLSRGRAQELNAEVTVMAKQVRNAQGGIFQDLEKDVRNFLNKTQWTDQKYAPHERIDCNILIQVKKRVSAGSFQGRIQIQSGRTVYNSEYNTTVLNYNDQSFKFEYVPNTTLRFSMDRYRSELTSVLAFYAYMIIGMDHDTFSLKGGTPYYEKAKTIVSNAQNPGKAGWDPQKKQKNRYWLVENLLSETYSPLRKCLYIYHRKGLDRMYEKPKKARKKVKEALMTLESLHQRRPGNFHLQLFFTAKANEIVKIYQKGDARMKKKVSDLLQRIDPSNTSKYKEITGGR
ncbi:MAG: DUF4835 family protein [Flavobacteriales bacterium]